MHRRVHNQESKAEFTVAPWCNQGGEHFFGQATSNG